MICYRHTVLLSDSGCKNKCYVMLCYEKHWPWVILGFVIVPSWVLCFYRVATLVVNRYCVYCGRECVGLARNHFVVMIPGTSSHSRPPKLLPPHLSLSLSLSLSLNLLFPNLCIFSHCLVFTVSVSSPFCVWESVWGRGRDRHRDTQRVKDIERVRERDMPCLRVCMNGVWCAYWRRQYLSTEAVR